MARALYFVFCASNCQRTPNPKPSGGNHRIPLLLLFAIYDGAMHLPCTPGSDICLCGRTDGAVRTREGLGYRENACVTSHPPNTSFFLRTSCPGGHEECVTATCKYPTYSVSLQHTHTPTNVQTPVCCICIRGYTHGHPYTGCGSNRHACRRHTRSHVWVNYV